MVAPYVINGLATLPAQDSVDYIAIKKLVDKGNKLLYSNHGYTIMEVNMEQKLDLDALTRNTRRLEFEDGLNDFQNALVFLILGGLTSLFMSTAGLTLYMRAILFNEEITTIALLALIPLLYLIMFGIRRLILRYRKEVLWRDLGEMEPFKWQVDRRVSVLATAIWLIVVIGGLFLIAGDPMNLDADMRIIAGAGGIATGVTYFAMGQSLALARYRWVGIIGGLLSAVLIFSPLGFSYSWVVLGIIWTGTLGTSGFLAYRKTMRRLRERSS